MLLKRNEISLFSIPVEFDANYGRKPKNGVLHWTFIAIQGSKLDYGFWFLLMLLCYN